MGGDRDAQGNPISSIIKPDPQNPQANPTANQGAYSLHKVLCPPVTRDFYERDAERMAGKLRYGEQKGKADDWNCHGFSANLVRNFVETFVRVRADTNVNWDQVLAIGAIHGSAPGLIHIPQGQVRVKSEYALEVQEDGSALLYLIQGQAEYEGGGHNLSLSSGQMTTIDQGGRPAAPARFDVAEIETWWQDLEPPRSAGLDLGWGEIMAGVGALGLVVVALVAWQGMRRRPLSPAVVAPVVARPARRTAGAPPPPPTERWGTLTVLRGQAAPRSLALDKSLVNLGRSSKNDLVVADDLVSRHHAQIRRRDGAALLYDLNSTNGIFVNGQRVAGPRPLSRGDVLTLGRAEVVYGSLAQARLQKRGRLLVQRGRAEPSVLDLGRLTRASIGRSRDNDLIIRDDVHVSRHHAQIRRLPQGYEIVDLNSAHGLWLNGRRVSRARLWPGDCIRLSHTEFLYE
jgi:pSer/pThr/pTyr-binding forkhead associated (FHA) protein